MKENRIIVKRYFEAGKSPAEIFNIVKTLGINRRFVNRTVNRLRETGSIEDLPRSGAPRTARTKKRIKVIRERIRRNPKRSQRKLAKDLKISTRSVGRIIKNDLGYKPYKLRKQHGLSASQVEDRRNRCPVLLARHDDRDVKNIIFSDEKLFVAEQRPNFHNDVIYALSVEDIPEELRTVNRFQKPNSVMVWGAVCDKGKLPLKFVEKGVKINQKYYMDEILDTHMKPWADLLYGQDQWTFQQDSAPAHKGKLTQEWCRQNCPDFISAQDWPPSSPDLNPLDYCVWGVMEERVNATIHRSLKSFKAAIEKEWDRLPLIYVRAAIAAWRSRLRKVVKRKGLRFE